MLLAALQAIAQQDAQFSQYMFNKSLINPAATGADGLNATLLYRNQWLNQPGAPKSFGIVVDAPVASNRVGLGLIVLSTSQGPLTFTRINTNYSFKINVGDAGGLYLGLQAGLVQYGIDRSALKTTTDASLDPAFAGNNLKRMIPDFGFGIMYKSEKFYVGINVPHLLQSRIKFINEVVDTSGMKMAERTIFTQIFRHYYATAGVNINVNDDIQVQPSIMTRYVLNAPFAADINCNVTYKKMVWAGLGYRISNLGGVVAMVGLNVSNTLRVGYAFDMTTGGVSSYTGTSHEIMLSYHLDAKEGTGKTSSKSKKKHGSVKKPYFLK